MSVAYFLITLILIYLLLVCYWCDAPSHEHPTDMDEVPVCVASRVIPLQAKSKQGSTKEICSRKEFLFFFFPVTGCYLGRPQVILRLNKINKHHPMQLKALEKSN